MRAITETNHGFTTSMTGYDWLGRASLDTQKATQRFQTPVFDVALAQMVQCVGYILAAAAKLTLSLVHKTEDLICSQIARILGVSAVDHESERFNRFREAHRLNRLHNLEINLGELFPLAEVSERFVPPGSRNLKQHTTARTPTVKPKDEAWQRWCTSVLMRIDAETAVESVERARQLAQELEARSPHQRTVAKHPAISAQTPNPSWTGRSQVLPYPARPPQSRAAHPVPA
jgi:hypothetical protein